MIRIQPAVVVVVAAIAGTGCGWTHASAPERTAADVAPPDHRDPGPDGMAIDRQTLAAAVKVDTVAERSIARTLTVGGKVQFDEDRVAHVLAPLAGQIVDVRVKIGDQVGKGQQLCAIGSRDAAAAAAEHVESHKDLELAEKTSAISEYVSTAPRW